MDANQTMSSTMEGGTAVFFDCVCRCCLTDQTTLKPIFNPVGSIPEKIFLSTAVEFAKDDGLPANICIDCLQQLDMCIEFKRQVEESAVFLRKSLEDLAQKIIIEDEDTSLYNQEHSSPNHSEVLAVSGEVLDYTCKHCERSYASKCAYNRHTKLHILKDNVFRCNECGKRFTNKLIFEDHKICHAKWNTSSKPIFTCQICKDIFAVEQDLLIHNSLHDDVAKCNFCDKDFESQAKLKRHIPQHFIDKPFKCNKCDMSFVEMASLTRHYQKHSRRKPKSIYLCSVCGKHFPNQYTLKVHIRNHTGERPWKCTSCDKRFADFRLLNSHKNLHVDDKPHTCHLCKKSFRHRSTLITHMRTHTGDRPFRCDKCKKSYKQSWSLRAHQRSHDVTERFLCNQCNEVLATATSLTDHLLWHSSQITSNDQQGPQAKEPLEYFQCKECSAQLLSRLDLITHEKLSHTLSHECGTCFGNWKTLEELIQHKCYEAMQASDEPTPDEMILLPNGEVQDCNKVVDALLASISQNKETVEQH